MFDHSIKVPRLYKTAAKIYKQVKEGSGSVKQLVYEKKHPNIKALYALIVGTLQNEDELEKLIQRSQIFKKEPRFDQWLAKILITELLFGKKRLAGDSKPIKTVLAYEQIFKAHLSDAPINRQLSSKTQVEKPRYVRINTLLCNLNEAIDGFREEGWTLTKCLDNKNYEAFLEKVSNLNEDEFLPDIHIPDLLIFPPKTQFYRHTAYKNGSIILQDKASCLPVHILGPPPGSVVLDMCSAPGMKTTQVAAAIKDSGTVYACEKDERRFQTLEKIVESSGATCIKCFNRDILSCDAETFPDVEYILVDPSCTGSGITDRLEVDSKQSEQRLNKLAGFQIKILRAALTKYPKVKRVVYSTCSIYPEENEDVVRQVLETNLNFKLVPAKKFLNDAWLNFGSPEYGDMGSFCLYAKSNEDLSNGFFVAVFERLEEGEENQFFNKKIYNFKIHEQDKLKRRKRDHEFQNENNQYEENYEDTSLGNWNEMHDSEVIEENHLIENEDTNHIDSKKKKRKRVDVEEVDVLNSETQDKKKKKKHSQENMEETTQIVNSEETFVEKSKKKKKKHSQVIEEEENSDEKTKKNKKKKHEIENLEEQNLINDENTIPKQKKKKKSKENIVEKQNEEICDEIPKTKKKKNKHQDAEESSMQEITVEENSNEKTKKKKKKKQEHSNDDLEGLEVKKTKEILNDESTEHQSKKHKKKKKHD